MAIQVVQITGDTVELVFEPAEDRLYVGQNLTIVGHQEARGLVVQVTELTASFSPTSLSPQTPHRSTRRASAARAAIQAPTRPSRRGQVLAAEPDVQGHYGALAKIRRMTDSAWHAWDGWLPHSRVSVSRTADHEVLRHCIVDTRQPLTLGMTLSGEPLQIDRAALGRSNLIAGGKTASPARLAQVIISGLVEQGNRCVVFDSSGAYAPLLSPHQTPVVAMAADTAVVHLVVGENLRLGFRRSGLPRLSEVLRLFGLPKTTALFFESWVRRHDGSPTAADTERRSAWLAVDDLVRLAEEIEAAGHVVAAGAILSCLEAMRATQIFASQAAEAMTFWESCAQIRQGGVLLIDLSKTPRRAQASLTRVLLGRLPEVVLSEWEAAGEPPCVFFDDAAALVTPHLFAEALSPSAQPALTSFLVTTALHDLDDACIREAENLFLRFLPSSQAVRKLTRHELIEPDSLGNIVRCLQVHDGLLIGHATQGYPIIFTLGPRHRAASPGEHSPLERHAALWESPVTTTRPRPRAVLAPPAKAEMDLPLFGDEPALDTADLSTGKDTRLGDTSPRSPPTVAQVTALWDQVVKRVARRRRILETILATARPLRVTDHRLVLGFPPQHRFQQELVESDEYRSLLEEELQKVFATPLEVSTEVSPA